MTNLSAASLPQIYRTTVRGYAPTREEIRTILKLAFLAYEIDLREDAAERSLLDSANAMLWRLAGQSPEPLPVVSPLPLPIDHEERRARVRELSALLPSTEARELAYSIAYLIAVRDHEMSPVESAFLDELRVELAIDAARADALSLEASRIITPGV